MPKHAISGFKIHPQAEALRDYSMDVPPERWVGRLDHVAWGKAHNLLCHFTEEATGQKYRLSTFWNSGYKPYRDGPAFNEEPLGGRYEIRTSRSKNGMAKFDSARRLDLSPSTGQEPFLERDARLIALRRAGLREPWPTTPPPCFPVRQVPIPPSRIPCPVSRSPVLSRFLRRR